MFIAKFSQTSGEPFAQDKNGNWPMIGEVLAGTATGTIINGTMFKRSGLEAQTLYACENENYDYENPTTGEITKQVRVNVISKVSLKEYLEMRTILGAPSLKVGEVRVGEPHAAGGVPEGEDAAPF